MHKGRSTPRRTSWRIGHLFLAHVKKVSPKLTAKWGTDWVKIPGQYAADVELYEHLTTYLTKTYIIEEEPNAGPMQHPEQQGCDPGLVSADPEPEGAIFEIYEDEDEGASRAHILST